MKIKLTQDFRVQLPAGTTITVDDNYAATLKALGVADVVSTRKTAKVEDAKSEK